MNDLQKTGLPVAARLLEEGDRFVHNQSGVNCTAVSVSPLNPTKLYYRIDGLAKVFDMPEYEIVTLIPTRPRRRDIPVGKKYLVGRFTFIKGSGREDWCIDTSRSGITPDCTEVKLVEFQ
jgi:hypothetical protein